MIFKQGTVIFHGYYLKIEWRQKWTIFFPKRLWPGKFLGVKQRA